MYRHFRKSQISNNVNITKNHDFQHKRDIIKPKKLSKMYLT